MKTAKIVIGLIFVCLLNVVGVNNTGIDLSGVSADYIDTLQNHNNSLHQAISDIGSSPATLVCNISVTLGQNETIPVNLHFIAYKGCVISSNGYQLTLNGPFKSGSYQVFSGFTSGDVSFGSGSIEGAYPEWWGSDETASDLTPIQCAIDSVRL